MKEYTLGQIFILKEDTDINIDDEETCTSKVCVIKEGTRFTIKLIEDFIDVYFDGYGVGVFTEEELFRII